MFIHCIHAYKKGVNGSNYNRQRLNNSNILLFQIYYKAFSLAKRKQLSF